MKQIYFFVISLLFSSGISSQNICNGGFEDGNSSEWNQDTNDGAISFSDEIGALEIYNGTTSLKVQVITPDSFRNKIESCDLDLLANHTYKISFWAKIDAGSDLGIRIKATAYDFVENITLTETEYEEVTYTFMPITDETSKIRLSFQTNGTYLIDDVTITDISYIDCTGLLNGTAYLDNCGQCTGGTSGNTPSCTATSVSGNVKNYTNNFYGFNSKNNSDGNFNEDDNIFEGAWKRTKAKIYRYPGGTFGNSFNWRTGNILVGARPNLLDTPITPADLSQKLPDDTDILWMVNVRVPLLPVNFGTLNKTWNQMTRAELLSTESLQAKITDVLDGLAAFKNAGKEVKYLELGNEFYFSFDEGFGEAEGAIGDGGDGKGDHFPYDKNPTVYIEQMGEIAEAVKAVYPNIKIAVIRWKMESGNQADWNVPINNGFATLPKVNQYIDAITYHWYQTEQYYEGQTVDSPSITNVASSQTAMGYAYDYIEFKKANDLLNIPTGKEAWVTEGDIKDPSTDDKWLDAIREAVVQINYGVFEHVTMHTPQIFQPLFVDYENLNLTVKGLGTDMTYAAAEDMTSAQALDLGGGLFFADNGGPYPDLQGIKFSNGNGTQDRMVLVNCSNNSYTVDLSSITNNTNLSRLERHNPAPWADGSHVFEKTTPSALTSIVLQPYSITILAEDTIVDILIDSSLRVTNPESVYPNRYVKVLDFNENIINSTYTKTLYIKNTGNSSLDLAATTPVNAIENTVFSVNQPSILSIPADSFTSFEVNFSPTVIGDFTDRIKVLLASGTELDFEVFGTGTTDIVLGLEDLELNSGMTIQSTGDLLKIENSHTPKVIDIVIYSLTGESVLELNNQSLRTEITIDLSNMNTGIYLVTLSSENTKIVKKIVVF